MVSGCSTGAGTAAGSSDHLVWLRVHARGLRLSVRVARDALPVGLGAAVVTVTVELKAFQLHAQSN